MPNRLDYGHLTSLFENATEGIILTDGKGNIMLFNPAAERMFGYQNVEIEGKPIETLIPRQFKPHHQQLREGFYAHPSNRAMGHNRDLFGQRKDGSAIPVEVSLSHYQRDNELFVIAFVVDITKRKEIENNMKRQQAELERISNELRKLNTELETKVEERTVILKEALQRLEQSQAELSEAFDKERQLNEIKSRFVSMASHEFRTPLSTVLSSASLLQKYTRTEEQDKRERHIVKIKSSVKNLNDILEDFLSLGKLEEGKVQSSMASFNLRECITDVADEMSIALKPGQHIEQAYEGQEIICSDKKLFRNIIINLVSNAIKFSGENTTIAISSKVREQEATVAVQDEGIGIGEDEQANLFTSFFRASNAVNIQGTGLGLHIVQRYAQLLGGTITLKSQLEQGTTATLSIPIG
ncbi:MAG TPA: PAS domain-containing sensor histidine kinase [Chitinophagaceae bacterium]|nr:PAS domain-containing sensor histidine kinase [Chitinophagaceae bacterium]